MPAKVWQVLNMKCMQWPETEIKLIWFAWKNSWNHTKEIYLFWEGFSYLEPLCMVAAAAHSGKLYDPQSDGQSFSLLIG